MSDAKCSKGFGSSKTTKGMGNTKKKQVKDSQIPTAQMTALKSENLGEMEI